MALSRRSSRPIFKLPHAVAETIGEIPVQRPAHAPAMPRRAARARFSAIDMCGAVPLKGILKHAANQLRPPMLRPARDVMARQGGWNRNRQ